MSAACHHVDCSYYTPLAKTLCLRGLRTIWFVSCLRWVGLWSCVIYRIWCDIHDFIMTESEDSKYSGIFWLIWFRHISEGSIWVSKVIVQRTSLGILCFALLNMIFQANELLKEELDRLRKGFQEIARHRAYGFTFLFNIFLSFLLEKVISLQSKPGQNAVQDCKKYVYDLLRFYFLGLAKLRQLRTTRTVTIKLR